MNEPLGIFADIAAAIIIMFIFPIAVCSYVADEIETDYIKIAADEFTGEICRFGYLDEEQYLSFVSSISGRKKWDITVEGVFDRFEPVYVNGDFSGEVVSYESFIPMEVIMDGIKERGKYQFRNDDRIRVKIFNQDSFGYESYGRITGICK